MTGTENTESTKQNVKDSGNPPEINLLKSTPNLFFLAYLVFLIFNIIRNTAAAVEHESLGTVIGYIAMLFIPFAAVAAYNLAKDYARYIGRASIGITAFFLLFSMVMELETASKSKHRLNGFQARVDALDAQREAANNYLPGTVPAAATTRQERIAVPEKGAVSLKMGTEPMKTVVLVNPAVARVATLSPYELRVMGVKKGITTLSIMDRAGYKFAYEVNVE